MVFSYLFFDDKNLRGEIVTNEKLFVGNVTEKNSVIENTKKIVALALMFVAVPACAGSCLDKDKLIALDQRYEKAVQQADVKFLDKLLADEFYWVHNLASLKEGKAQLLARIQKEEKPKERRSYDLSVRKLENTAVVEGLSSVDKWNADGKTFRTSRYQVIRTYVDVKGECKLLAIQSMKVWSSDGQ
jgi:hypothetical protein